MSAEYKYRATIIVGECTSHYDYETKERRAKAFPDIAYADSLTSERFCRVRTVRVAKPRDWRWALVQMGKGRVVERAIAGDKHTVEYRVGVSTFECRYPNSARIIDCDWRRGDPCKSDFAACDWKLAEVQA